MPQKTAIEVARKVVEVAEMFPGTSPPVEPVDAGKMARALVSAQFAMRQAIRGIYADAEVWLREQDSAAAGNGR